MIRRFKQLLQTTRRVERMKICRDGRKSNVGRRDDDRCYGTHINSVHNNIIIRMLIMDYIDVYNCVIHRYINILFFRIVEIDAFIVYSL